MSTSARARSRACFAPKPAPEPPPNRFLAEVLDTLDALVERKGHAVTPTDVAYELYGGATTARHGAAARDALEVLAARGEAVRGHRGRYLPADGSKAAKEGGGS